LFELFSEPVVRHVRPRHAQLRTSD
jgi:hypothetical protein